MNEILENLRRVRQKAAQAALSCGRQPEEVKIVAVSKTFPACAIESAAAAGQLAFGENRVQEAAAKIPLVATSQTLEWHLIGHLQSNKSLKAAALFDWVHSVDSVKLMGRLNEGASEVGKVLPVLLQVDLAGEVTKSGAGVEELRLMLAAAPLMDHLSVRGLMIIPPYLPDPEEVRPYFRQLRDLRDQLAAESLPGVVLTELSMGMSHDFEVAITEGATMIRVGSAIFGTRGIAA
jgi:PLP dependent protein